MSKNIVKEVTELFSAPLGELIASVGKGVGEAQAALDENSMRQTLSLYGENNPSEIVEIFRQIGYKPTFYTIPETEVEAKISISLNKTNTNQADKNAFAPSLRSIVDGRLKATSFPVLIATPVNDENANNYNINGNTTATIKFKIIPVPTIKVQNLAISIPNIIGKNVLEVIEIVKSLGLNYILQTEKGSKKLTEINLASKVIDTQPKIGETINIGATINIILSE